MIPDLSAVPYSGNESVMADWAKTSDSFFDLGHLLTGDYGTSTKGTRDNELFEKSEGAIWATLIVFYLRVIAEDLHEEGFWTFVPAFVKLPFGVVGAYQAYALHTSPLLYAFSSK